MKLKQDVSEDFYKNKMKDGVKGKIFGEFVGLKPKMY